jgi:hypothetical protein
MAARTKDDTNLANNNKPRYSVATISKTVAIETELGDRIILTDPDIETVEFISWEIPYHVAKSC